MRGFLLFLLELVYMPVWVLVARREPDFPVPRYPAALLILFVLGAYVYAAIELLPGNPVVFALLLGTGLLTALLLWLVRERPRRRRRLSTDLRREDGEIVP